MNLMIHACTYSHSGSAPKTYHFVNLLNLYLKNMPKYNRWFKNHKWFVCYFTSAWVSMLECQFGKMNSIPILANTEIIYTFCTWLLWKTAKYMLWSKWSISSWKEEIWTLGWDQNPVLNNAQFFQEKKIMVLITWCLVMTSYLFLDSVSRYCFSKF